MRGINKQKCIYVYACLRMFVVCACACASLCFTEHVLCCVCVCSNAYRLFIYLLSYLLTFLLTYSLTYLLTYLFILTNNSALYLAIFIN